MKKIDEFCKDLWNEISNSKFFDFIGRIIHTQDFRDLVEYFVGIFYQVGGVDLIKSLSAIGTYCAVFQRKHPLLATLFGGVGIIGNLTQLFYYVTLNAVMDDNGVYHMIPDCWQQNTHYSTGYDDVFRSAVNEASEGSITVDVHQSNIFWVDLDGDNFKDDGEDFIIWSWKGDYMNLGAGAETGIYQVRNGDIDEYGNYINESGEYSYLYAEVNREYSINMSLELLYDNNGDGVFNANEILYDYTPTEKQWWITGFDPQTQNVKSDELQSITTIDFSSFGENKDIMLDAFREFNSGESEWDIPEEDSDSYTVTLIW